MSTPYIPPELLPTPSLKSARLTCSTWSQIGAPHLLTRIYFAPRPATISTFLAITSRPIFSRKITELVYDDSLFGSPLATNEEEHEADVYRAWFDGRWVGEGSMGMPTEEGVKGSFEKYRALYKYQECVLASGEAERILLEGIRRLPNLRRIMVIGGGFSRDAMAGARMLHQPNLAGPDLQWYAESGPLGKECKATLLPMTWPTHERWDEEEKEEEVWGRTMTVTSPRGLQGLFWALKTAESKIEMLQIGTREVCGNRVGMPVEELLSLGREELEVFRYIKEMSLVLDVRSCRLGGEDGLELAALFGAAGSVKTLGLKLVHTRLLGTLEEDLLSSLVLPQLEAVRLEDFYIAPQKIARFCGDHIENVQHVELRNCISTGAPWRTFRDIYREQQERRQHDGQEGLKSLSISGLREWPEIGAPRVSEFLLRVMMEEILGGHDVDKAVIFGLGTAWIAQEGMVEEWRVELERKCLVLAYQHDLSIDEEIDNLLDEVDDETERVERDREG